MVMDAFLKLSFRRGNILGKIGPPPIFNLLIEAKSSCPLAAFANNNATVGEEDNLVM